MNKWLSLGFIGLLSVLIMSGCSFRQIIDKVSPQADGVILYGDEDTVNQDIDDNSKDLKSSATYDIKMGQDEDKQKVMMMNQKTAKDLVKKGLLRKVDDEDDAEPLKDLPKVTNDRPVLFAKEEVKDLKIGKEQYDVRYEGNVIIGDARRYADSFMVVDDSTWDAISGKEKVMGVLQFDKKHNPEKKIGDFKAEKDQLISFDD